MQSFHTCDNCGLLSLSWKKEKHVSVFDIQTMELLAQRLHCVDIIKERNPSQLCNEVVCDTRMVNAEIVNLE